MSIHSLTKELYEHLLQEITEKTNELAIIKKTDPIDMYREDLLKLKQVLKNSIKN